MRNPIPLLQQAVASKQLRELDRYLAEQLMALANHPDIHVAVLIALLSRAAGDGDVCLELSKYAGQAVFLEPESQRPLHVLAELEELRQALLASGIVAIAGQGQQQALVLDEDQRLYLARYHHYETVIEQQIRMRLTPQALSEASILQSGLQRAFPVSPFKPDRQKLAAAVAMLQPFCVISGGPGTGKTTTVTRILALYLQLHGPSRIALVAPTGKAAARLTESIRAAKQGLGDLDPAILQQIPEQASTVHRLLKPIRNSSQFQHNADHPLYLDLLIVDEASMLDVPLMAKLLAALPEQCRIILLGDRDQLASVEAGSVFSDLCNRGRPIHYSQQRLDSLHDIAVETGDMDSKAFLGMADSVAVLTDSHRFGHDSGIGQLARAINTAAIDTALEVCAAHPDTELRELPPQLLVTQLTQHAIKGFEAYLHAEDPATALQHFGDYRILCALREGEYGVLEINQRIETALRQAKLIDTSERYYHGRPIMIRSNDYNLQLYNGDIGICLRDPDANQRIRVFFQDAEGQLRAVLPSRLPDHETAYAMTVHKSQGSEFERCLLILPQRDSAVLTRELIYTGITRAKIHIAIWCGDLGVFKAAIERKVERHSGLYAKLWPAP